MIYQAYQAHSDIMVPVRAFAGAALRYTRARMNGAAKPNLLSNLTAAYELITRAGGNRGGGRPHAVRHPLAFQEGRRHRATTGAGDRAAVGPFRDAAACHHQDHVART
jgi:hypothetical protein